MIKPAKNLRDAIAFRLMMLDGFSYCAAHCNSRGEFIEVSLWEYSLLGEVGIDCAVYARGVTLRAAIIAAAYQIQRKFPKQYQQLSSGVRVGRPAKHTIANFNKWC